MLQYIPFTKEFRGGNDEEIAVTYPGHVLGVYLRLYLNGVFYPHFLWVSVSDIGASKEYIVEQSPFEVFTLDNPEQGPLFAMWIKPIFIPLDHTIENNHILSLETKINTNPTSETLLMGYFVYNV